MARCAFVSFRFGPLDGVSVVARAWADALGRIGYDPYFVAGSGDADIIVPGLEIDAADPPDVEELERALRPADLVVVENLCSIPLNLPAARAVAGLLAGRPAIMHHHDPPWQRARFRHVAELPYDDPAWRHVTINELTRREMADRGITATTIYNGFDVDPPVGDRAGTRAALAVAPEQLLVAHPVRAIARKNIPAAIELTAELGGVYWLLGPVEENYDDELVDVLAAARCPVLHVPLGPRENIYAAADLIVFPSTWEGFGNPPIEAAIHRRPVVVGDYPVADELLALGFRWFRPDGVDEIRAWLDQPNDALLDHNEQVARRELSSERMTERLHALIADAGWDPI